VTEINVSNAIRVSMNREIARAAKSVVRESTRTVITPLAAKHAHLGGTALLAKI
jgi:post-segregation antitoxin (ccd killing protein)